MWFHFWNFFNVCILNINTWLAIIKFGGHHAYNFGILYSSGGHIGFNYTHTSLNRSDCVELSWTGSSCMEIPATDTSYCEMTCNNTYFDYAKWECINRTWDRSNSTCQDMAVNETLCYWHHPYYSYVDSNDTDWDWYTWNNFVKRTLNIDSGLVRNCSSGKNDS